VGKNRAIMMHKIQLNFDFVNTKRAIMMHKIQLMCNLMVIFALFVKDSSASGGVVPGPPPRGIDPGPHGGLSAATRPLPLRIGKNLQSQQ